MPLLWGWNLFCMLWASANFFEHVLGLGLTSKLWNDKIISVSMEKSVYQKNLWISGFIVYAFYELKKHYNISPNESVNNLLWLNSSLILIICNLKLKRMSQVYVTTVNEKGHFLKKLQTGITQLESRSTSFTWAIKKIHS